MSSIYDKKKIDTFSSYLKYPLTKYLKGDMEKVIDCYYKYIKDEDNKIKYINLKESIFNMSIEIKSELITGEVNNQLGNEIREKGWDLIA